MKGFLLLACCVSAFVGAALTGIAQNPAPQLRLQAAVTESGGVAAIGSPPALFRLNEPRPNPVDHAAYISFYLPEEEYAELLLFDGDGNEKAVLHRGVLAAGYHSLTWRPDETLAMGGYMLALKTRHQNTTRRIWVL
jgi:hypothetical protein